MRESQLIEITNLTNLYVGGIVADPIVDCTIQKNRRTKEPIIHSSSLKGAIKCNIFNNFKQYIKDKKDYLVSFQDLYKKIYKIDTIEEIDEEKIEQIKNEFLDFIFGKETNINDEKSLSQIGYVNFFDAFFYKETNNITQHLADIENLYTICGKTLNKNEKKSNYIFKSEIRTHIAIDYETGKAKDGALWNQEYVPPNCTFVSLIMFNNYLSHNNKDLFKNLFISILTNSLFQIGGLETNGCGFCEIKLIEDENNGVKK